MKLFNRRRKGSKGTNGEEGPVGLSLRISNRTKNLESTSRKAKEELPAENISTLNQHEDENQHQYQHQHQHQYSSLNCGASQSVHPFRAPSHALPTSPLSPSNPNGLTRTAHWFNSSNGETSAAAAAVGSTAVEVEMLEVEAVQGVLQPEQEPCAETRTAPSLPERRRGSVSSIASIPSSINGMSISRIFKANNGSEPQIKPPSTSSPCNPGREFPSSPPSSYRNTTSDLHHKRSYSNLLSSTLAATSPQCSTSMPSSQSVTPSASALSPAPTSSRLSRVRAKSTHRPVTSDGVHSASRRLSPHLPGSPSGGRRSIDFSRPTFEPVQSPQVPTSLKIVAEHLLESHFNWESRLSLVLEWVGQPKSELRTAGKEKCGMSKIMSPWHSKKTASTFVPSEYTSVRGEMELLEIFLTETVMKEIAQGRSNKEIEMMRLSSVFREARQFLGLEGKSKFRVSPAVTEVDSLVIGVARPDVPLSPHQRVASDSSRAQQAHGTNPILTLGPALGVTDDDIHSTTVSPQAPPFGFVSLTPAPRKKKRPTTAPEDRKRFNDLPPSPQVNKSSHEDNESKRLTKESHSKSTLKSVSAFNPYSSFSSNHQSFPANISPNSSKEDPRFSSDSFGNRSDTPSHSASSAGDSSIGHPNLRQLSLGGGDLHHNKLKESQEANQNLHFGLPGLDAPPLPPVKDHLHSARLVRESH